MTEMALSIMRENGGLCNKWYRNNCLFLLKQVKLISYIAPYAEMNSR